MKKILVIALIAVFGTAMFFACEKDNPQSTKSQDALECSFDDIDSMSSEVASFHEYYMTYFLNTIFPNIQEFNDSSFQLFMSSIKEQVSKYDFSITTVSSEQFDLATSQITLPFLKNINLWYNNNFDINSVDFGPTIKEQLATVDFKQVSNLISLIDDKVISLIEESNSFDDFKDNYKKMIDYQLDAIKQQSLKKEYLFAKFYSDTYLSSLSYLENYWCKDCKGPRWEKFKGMVKEAWKIAKPIVTADATGAAFGAVVGMPAGPEGIVVSGMTYACGNSAAACFN